MSGRAGLEVEEFILGAFNSGAHSESAYLAEPFAWLGYGLVGCRLTVNPGRGLAHPGFELERMLLLIREQTL